MNNRIDLTGESCGCAKPELNEREIKAIQEVAMGMSHAELEAFLQVVPVGLLCNEIERRTTKYARFVSAVAGSMDILKGELV